MKTRDISGQKLHDWQKRFSSKAREVSHATDDYVHENAWSSVAFAAVIGCVVGFLMGNRQRD